MNTLDEMLGRMRRVYGDQTISLVSNGHTPEHRQWAKENGVELYQSTFVEPGHMYLINPAALRRDDMIGTSMAQPLTGTPDGPANPSAQEVSQK